MNRFSTNENNRRFINQSQIKVKQSYTKLEIYNEQPN